MPQLLVDRASIHQQLRAVYVPGTVMVGGHSSCMWVAAALPSAASAAPVHPLLPSPSSPPAAPLHHLLRRSVAVEAQFYLLSPLILWAAFSPARRAPRKFGLAGLCASTLVGVAINAGIMGTQGISGFTT